MQEVTARLAEEAVLVFCLLFAPAGEKEVLIDVLTERGPSDRLVAVRTETGFEISEKIDRAGKRKRRIVTVRRVARRPFVFDIKDSRDRDSRLDLSDAGKAVKPFRDAPHQRFKVQGATLDVTASGKLKYVFVHHMRASLVVHGAGRTGRPTTRPAGSADPPPAKMTGHQAARQFWTSLTRGDVDGMGALYAEKVVIKAGSELLWKVWGISKTGDRTKDAIAARDKVIRAWKRLIAKTGKDKWVRMCSQEHEGVQPTTTTAADDGEVFPEVRAGDVIFKPSPGSTEAIWVLRKNKAGQWRVVIEKFDI